VQTFRKDGSLLRGLFDECLDRHFFIPQPATKFNFGGTVTAKTTETHCPLTVYAFE
jgi:hypothetical protein